MALISFKEMKENDNVIPLMELNPTLFAFLCSITWTFNHGHTMFMLESK
jgi:hypothetical protein